MSKLEDELEELVGFVGSGGGFGSPDAVEQHQREIDLLKFKITRRDNLKIAIVSAIIGATVGAGVTLVNQLIG
jgi:hypothetical protein